MKNLSLVLDGLPRAVVVSPDDASSDISETARDLASIIARMSGAVLPVVSEAVDGPVLMLGAQDRDGSLPPLAYHVWREDKMLHFSGGSDHGVINGVYAFLEEELGCRWYTPDALGEYIPRRATIEVGNLDMQDSPDYGSIAGFGRHRDEKASRLWKRRNRLEGFPKQFHSHNWSRIVPPSLMDEHPEWFALVGKKRNRKQFCTTQPGVLERTVAAAREWFDEHPDYQTFSLSPSDFRGFCQCKNCCALDAELGVDPFAPGGSMTDRLVHFFNQVAAEVVKTHPDRRLAFYAYMTYTKPPEVVKLHPMLLPVVVHTPWDYCMHHPIDDPDCERNRRFADYVQKWHRLTKDLFMYDYWGHWSIWGPIGLVHTIRRDLPWMHRHGCVGFYAEAWPQWWTQGLNLYLPTKLGWNIDADVDAIVAEYYENMFGPAADTIAGYGQVFEEATKQIPRDRDRDFDGAYLASMSPELIAQAKALLDDAEREIEEANLPEDEIGAIFTRLKRYRYGLRIAEVQSQEKQKRREGRMEQVIDLLNKQISLLDEIAADPELKDMVEVPWAQRTLRMELMRLPPYNQIWERAVPEPERRAELKQMLDEGQTREVAKALGYWSDWFLVGLWPNDEGNLLDTPYPPEDGVDLEATYTVRSGEAGWRLHRSGSPYGIVDLAKFFYPEDSEYTVAYAYTTLRARSDIDVRMDVSCDDDIVLWVNGELVFAGGAVTGNFDIHIDTHLREGENTILAKVFNKPHAFNFSLRIADKDGRRHEAIIWET